eukprot:symbB.v1.2.041010.t1/scaffold7742.1/size9585/1
MSNLASGASSRWVMSSQHLGPSLAMASCVLYCLNGELLQALQAQEGHHASPLLNLLFCHLGGLLLVPHFGHLGILEVSKTGGIKVESQAAQFNLNLASSGIW